MDILYQQNNLVLRSARLADCALLAAELRRLDREELAASCGGADVRKLLESFYRVSVKCIFLQYKNHPAALFGLAPEVWMGRRACVWLLTGKSVEKIPKSFFCAARTLLKNALNEYEELYNFVDERYLAARRFVERLGGVFDGSFVTAGGVKFLRFTFRRKEYGRNC